MSLWGILDNVAATGTVTSYAGNATVNGSGTAFLSNIKPLDYITIDSRKFQVESVTSDTVLTLTGNGIAASGVTAFVQQGPKYLANVSNGNLNEPTIQDVYGVDRVEIAVPENKARGVASHTGWTTYKTYTDAHGQTRHKSEVLVALSKNFASNANGALFGTGAGTDADDDTVAADYFLYFTTQPVSASNTTGNAVVFTSVATSEPAGATLAYQWYEANVANGDSFTAVVDGGDYSGNTTNILTIANVSNVDGFNFYVTISSNDGGADSNTSTTVVATEA